MTMTVLCLRDGRRQPGDGGRGRGRGRDGASDPRDGDM